MIPVFAIIFCLFVFSPAFPQETWQDTLTQSNAGLSNRTILKLYPIASVLQGAKAGIELFYGKRISVDFALRISRAAFLKVPFRMVLPYTNGCLAMELRSGLRMNFYGSPGGYSSEFVQVFVLQIETSGKNLIRRIICVI